MQSPNVYTTREQLSDIVIGSVHDVFLARLAMEVFPGPIIDKAQGKREESLFKEISVIIGFSGAFNGGLRFSCPLPVALVLAESMGKQMVAVIGSEANDALAQLANVIANNVRTRVFQQDNREGDIYLAPPAVLSGNYCGLSYGKHAFSIKQTFQVDAGSFFVECFYLDVDE